MFTIYDAHIEQSTKELTKMDKYLLYVLGKTQDEKSSYQSAQYVLLSMYL